MGVLYTKSGDANLDTAMERALSEGPLTIIRPGKPTVVMLSEQEYRRLGGTPTEPEPPSLIDCLLQRPLEEGIDFDALIGDRHAPATRRGVLFDENET